MEVGTSSVVTLLILVIPIICSSFAFIFYRSALYMNISILVASAFLPALCIYLITIFMSTTKSFLVINIFNIFDFEIEPLGLIFITMASFLWWVTNLYCWSYLKMNPEINQKKFYFFLSVSMLCSLLIAFSSDLIITFVFYELLTIFTYPLVANVGTDHERRASRKYISILLSASLMLFLPAILITLHHVGHVKFSVGGIMHGVSGSTPSILLIMFLYGVAKTSIFPMHAWLPEAMVAPIPVSAFLHAVAVVKAGIFVILKIIVYIFGVTYLRNTMADIFNANIFTIFCAISLIISSLFTLYQTTIKKLLAYSTINQLSMCLLSASMFHPLAIKATVLHMVSHALAKITLFFAGGYLYCNSRITEVKDLAGLGRSTKITMLIFTLASLSIIGVPIFSGFVSKSYILFSALNEQINYIILLVMTFSIGVSAHYFMKTINIIYYAKNSDNEKNRITYREEIASSMVIAMFISCFLMVMYFVLYTYILKLVDRVSY